MDKLENSAVRINKFILSCFLLLSMCFSTIAEAQIVDIHSPNIDDQFNGVYYKDLSGIYDPYLGVWKGEANGKIYEFHVIKFVKVRRDYQNGTHNFKDKVRIKFEVKDATSNFILYSSLNNWGVDDYPIHGEIVPQLTLFYFNDTVENCRNSAQFGLERVTGNPNQLIYSGYRLLGPQTPTCSYVNPADIPIFLPTQNLVLTKQ